VTDEQKLRYIIQEAAQAQTREKEEAKENRRRLLEAIAAGDNEKIRKLRRGAIAHEKFIEFLSDIEFAVDSLLSPEESEDSQEYILHSDAIALLQALAPVMPEQKIGELAQALATYQD